MADHGDRRTRPTDADVTSFLDDVDRDVLDELIARSWATNHVEDDLR